MNQKSSFMRVGFVLVLNLFFSMSFGTVLAAPSKIEPISASRDISTVTPSLFPGVFESPQADWVFSGIVRNESGEPYHYFFQIRRNQDKFYADAVLVNAQKNQLILYETSEASIQKSDGMRWQVGPIYLRFNSINNSWVFGVKKHDNKGFNFRVDMLGQVDGAVAKEQDLRTGLELLIGQTGRLNGHLQTDNHEEFVVAKKAWFRQMWISKPQQSAHPFTAVLCDFKNGAGFYAVNLQGTDALRGAMAGWRDQAGVAQPMSQFVTAKKEKDGIWRIHVPFPKRNFTLKDTLPKAPDDVHLAAGAIDGNAPGFCVVTHYELG